MYGERLFVETVGDSIKKKDSQLKFARMVDAQSETIECIYNKW